MYQKTWDDQFQFCEAKKSLWKKANLLFKDISRILWKSNKILKNIDSNSWQHYLDRFCNKFRGRKKMNELPEILYPGQCSLYFSPVMQIFLFLMSNHPAKKKENKIPMIKAKFQVFDGTYFETRPSVYAFCIK